MRSRSSRQHFFNELADAAPDPVDDDVRAIGVFLERDAVAFFEGGMKRAEAEEFHSRLKRARQKLATVVSYAANRCDWDGTAPQDVPTAPPARA